MSGYTGFTGHNNISAFPGQDPEPAPMRKHRVFRPGKQIPVIVALLLLLYFLISFLTQFQRLHILQKDIHGIELQVQELRSRNEELKIQLKQVQSDTYIEQVAREKLGLVKPGEARIVPMPKSDGKNN